MTTDWRCIAMHDLAERRGVWYRQKTDNILEMRAGREGDDASVEFALDELPQSVASGLVAVCEYGAWTQEDFGPNTEVMPR